MALLESVIPEFDLLGLVRQPSGTGLDGVAPSNIFRTNDNKWVVIAASKDNLFIELCRVMGRPELAVDPRFRDHVARGVNQSGVERIVAEWAGTKSAADIDHVLRHAGIPSGPVNSVADVVADEHLRERGAFVVHRDKELGEFVGPGVVPRLSRTPGGVRWSGEWTPGAHNDEIFGELLGLTRNELEELSAIGIL
jgi:formyl-CoA transferase